MLIIRLQRTGKKNQADFRIVLAEKTSPVNKKFTEILGSYNPRKKNFQVKEERLKYWVSQHVQISPTVHNLLVNKSLLSEPKVKAFSTPKKEATPAVPAAPATTETPAEVAEATAEVEAKVETAPEVAAKPEAAAADKAENAAPEQPVA